MEVAVFEPLGSTDNGLFGMIALGAIACLALGFWGLKMKKQLVWMLSFFGVAILGGNAVFTIISNQYVTSIIIYEDKIDTPLGLIDFDDLRSAKIEGEQLGLKKINKDAPPEMILILERKNGKGVILAETQYPIYKIKDALDTQMQVYQEKK